MKNLPSKKEYYFIEKTCHILLHIFSNLVEWNIKNM